MKRIAAVIGIVLAAATLAATPFANSPKVDAKPCAISPKTKCYEAADINARDTRFYALEDKLVPYPAYGSNWSAPTFVSSAASGSNAFVASQGAYFCMDGATCQRSLSYDVDGTVHLAGALKILAGVPTALYAAAPGGGHAFALNTADDGSWQMFDKSGGTWNAGLSHAAGIVTAPYGIGTSKLTFGPASGTSSAAIEHDTMSSGMGLWLANATTRSIQNYTLFGDGAGTYLNSPTGYFQWQSSNAAIATLDATGSLSVNGSLSGGGWVGTSDTFYGLGRAARLVGQTPAGAGPGVVLDSQNNLTSGALLSVRNAGVEKASVDTGGNISAAGAVYGTAFFPNPDGGPGLYFGSYADDASAIGAKIGNWNTLTIAGGKLAGFYNGGVEKAYVTKDGAIVSKSSIMADTVAPFSAGPVQVLGGSPNSGSAVGVILDNYSSLSAAGSKLLSVRNAGSEKAYIDPNGYLYTVAVRSPESSAVYLQGWAYDSGAAVGTVIDNLLPLSAGGARIASFRNAGVEKAWVDYAGSGTFNGNLTVNSGSIYAHTLYAQGFAQKISLVGGPADSGSAVGVEISTPAYSAAGAKLLSIKNGSTEKASVDYTGRISTGGAIATTGNVEVGNLVYNPSSAALQITGTTADGASAVGAAVINSNVTMANAGSKLVSFRNNTVEKLAIGFDGRLIGAPYSMGTFFTGKPGNAAIMYRVLFAEAVRFPASLTGSKFYIGTNPTTSANVLTIRKRLAAGSYAADPGSLSISTAGVFTVTFASQTDFAVGDAIEIVNQGTANTTAADFSITLLGSRL